MKDKRGFTLVEVLAVIALIGIILLLVVPNVLKLYNNARKSIFVDEALSLYNNAYTTYIYRSSTGDHTKRFCSGNGGATNELDIEDNGDIFYDITVNSYGEVISMKVANSSFGLDLSDYNGIKKKNIKSDNVINSFNIDCGEVDPNPPVSTLTCIITDDVRECTIFNFTYNVQTSNI